MSSSWRWCRSDVLSTKHMKDGANGGVGFIHLAMEGDFSCPVLQ